MPIRIKLESMRNCLRRKIKVPLYIFLFLLVLFLMLFYKHIKNVHHKRALLNRLLSYETFLHELESDVNQLNEKMNGSSHTVRKLSRMLSPATFSGT